MFSDATRQFILQHRYDDINRLALIARTLDSNNIDIPAAIIQIAGRQAIEHKIPSWYENDRIVYPQSLSLEQCSSEVTARYKASIVSGHSFIDLTGGFGVDCSFIARQFQTAIYVEKQKELCDIASNNFAVSGLDQIKIVNDSSEHYIQEIEQADCIYLDPARRDHSGKKTVAISDCEPDINRLKASLLEKAKQILIKLSPMLDITKALQTLTETSRIHIVSVDNECKELLFLMQKNWNTEPEIICVNLKKDGNHSSFSFYRSEEKNTGIDCTSEIKEFLYEPNSSLLKAGAYKLIAERFKLDKLHTDSHLYTSSHWIPDFPGRGFVVQDVISFNKNELKTKLGGISQANLCVRNFPMSVNELRKKLKLREGGEDYLFATTLKNGRKTLIVGKRPVKKGSNQRDKDDQLA